MKNWIFDENGASDPQNLAEPYYAFSQEYYDAEEGIHKRISWNWENISKSELKFGPKIMKNWIFDEKVHRTAKPHRTVFHFYARYYDAGEVIHKRISWNWENFSKSGHKIWPIITKNWNLMRSCIGSPKPHRTFFPFSQDITMLKKWFISTFPEIEKISQNLGLKLGQ